MCQAQSHCEGRSVPELASEVKAVNAELLERANKLMAEATQISSLGEERLRHLIDNKEYAKATVLVIGGLQGNLLTIDMKEHKNLNDQHLDDVDMVLQDPSTSHWLRNSLLDSLDRDPVDAANDAQVLAELLDARMNRFIGMHLPPQA